MNGTEDGMDDFQREVGEWADRTFPRSTPNSIMLHFREESQELAVSVGGLGAHGEYAPVELVETAREEAADCVLLLLHLAHKEGFDLLAAAREKHERNTRRTWETDGGGKGYWKHVAPALPGGAEQEEDIPAPEPDITVGGWL